MTALSGGEQLDDELTPLNSVLERSDRGAGEAQRGPRSLDEIFPLRGDVNAQPPDAGDVARLRQRDGRRGAVGARYQPIAAGDRLCDRRDRA